MLGKKRRVFNQLPACLIKACALGTLTSAIFLQECRAGKDFWRPTLQGTFTSMPWTTNQGKEALERVGSKEKTKTTGNFLGKSTEDISKVTSDATGATNQTSKNTAHATNQGTEYTKRETLAPTTNSTQIRCADTEAVSNVSSEKSGQTLEATSKNSRIASDKTSIATGNASKQTQKETLVPSTAASQGTHGATRHDTETTAHFTEVQSGDTGAVSQISSQETGKASDAVFNPSTEKSGQTLEATSKSAGIASDQTSAASDKTSIATGNSSNHTQKETLAPSTAASQGTQRALRHDTETTAHFTEIQTGDTGAVSQISSQETGKASDVTSDFSQQQSTAPSTHASHETQKATQNSSEYSTQNTVKPSQETASQTKQNCSHETQASAGFSGGQSQDTQAVSQTSSHETGQLSDVTTNSTKATYKRVKEAVSQCVDTCVKKLQETLQETRHFSQPRVVRVSLNPSAVDGESTWDSTHVTLLGTGISIQEASILISMNSYFTSGTGRDAAQEVQELNGYKERREEFLKKANSLLQRLQTGGGTGSLCTSNVLSKEDPNEAYSCRIQVSQQPYIVAPGFFSESGSPTYFFVKVLQYTTATSQIASLESNTSIPAEQKAADLHELREVAKKSREELLGMIQHRAGYRPMVSFNISSTGLALVRAEYIVEEQ